MAVIQKTSGSQRWRSCAERRTLHGSWEYTPAWPQWKSIQGILKRKKEKEKAEFCTVQSSHGVLGHFPEGVQVKMSQRHLHTRVDRCTTHTSWEMTRLDVYGQMNG